MRTLIQSWDPSLILSPFQDPSRARTAAFGFDPNLTIKKGQSIARSTVTNKGVPYVSGGANGSANWVGFSKFSFVTDANGLIYLGEGITAVPDVRSGPFMSAPIYRSGTFLLADISSAAAVVAQVDTFTPATIEVGDKFTLTLTRPDLSTKAVTVTATAATAANVSALMIAAWNADVDLAAVATASGAATVILTAVTPGIAFTVAATTLNGGAADTQTFTRAATTAPSGISSANLLASIPGSRLLDNGALLIP